MDKTTRLLIEDFQQRMQVRTTKHLQDLEMMFADALRRDLNTLNRLPPPSLSKRVFQGIGKLGQWLSRRLRDYLSTEGGRRSEPTPEEGSPIVIEGVYRVLSPHQERE